jgi:hypothetical protein
MKLCMFSPAGHALERGWVGRIDDDRVVHLAAQTLQSLFTGGGAAREHAEYRLTEVRLLAPVLHPPTIRIFDSQTSFAFANASAVMHPDEEAVSPSGPLCLLPRLAAVIGAEGAVAGFTGLADWRAVGVPPPKDRDFGFGLGPLVVTPDELHPEGLEAVVRVDGTERARGRFGSFDWAAARELAALGTVLRPGDLLGGPALESVNEIGSGGLVELELVGIGTLGARGRSRS